jgi:hypothetical protein
MDNDPIITLIETLIILYALYVLLALSMLAVVLAWNVLKMVLKLAGWILVWGTGAKDLLELARRFDRWTVETRERQIARGSPATLRGVLKVLCWRVWKVFEHPIRSWRGEFVYPPKKGTTDASGREL